MLPRLSSRFDCRILVISGLLLIGSGLFHTVVWWWSGEPLAGPVSWRKPILFGFASGVTALSLAWVATKMRGPVFSNILASIFSIALVAEVGLITLQQWRGVPSHFNRTTLLDSYILSAMNWLILAVTLVIGEYCRRSFTRLRADQDMAIAIRAGMLLLLFSCLLGFGISFYGDIQIAAGQPPELMGQSGVTKFPHGIPMHAIQFLPLLVVVLRWWGFERVHRIACAWTAAIAYVFLTLYSMVQTMAGKSRLEFFWPSALLLLLALGFATVPTAMVLIRRQIARNSHPESATIH